MFIAVGLAGLFRDFVMQCSAAMHSSDISKVEARFLTRERATDSFQALRFALVLVRNLDLVQWYMDMYTVGKKKQSDKAAFQSNLTFHFPPVSLWDDDW